MAKKFDPSLKSAWIQYQDLYDRHMFLLRLVGESVDIEDIKSVYASQIEYAMKEWSTAQERFETGGYEDFGLGLTPDEDF